MKVVWKKSLEEGNAQDTRVTVSPSPDNARSESVLAVNPLNDLNMVGASKRFTDPAKYGINVPVSGSYGVTQDLLWTTAPYDATKNFVGTNCYTPLVDSKTAQGKLALAAGKKAGVSDASLAQTNYTLGWCSRCALHFAR